jgi:cell division protein FtsW (lipid II flippase)
LSLPLKLKTFYHSTLPVIGVPLPLMSVGLSSVLATFIAIGFAISVQLRRFVN